MEFLEYMSVIGWIVAGVGVIGVWLAPLGCWTKLHKIDQRARYLHENGYESMESSKEILRI